MMYTLFYSLANIYDAYDLLGTMCTAEVAVDVASLALPDPRRQPIIAYSMNARRERVWEYRILFWPHRN